MFHLRVLLFRRSSTGRVSGRLVQARLRNVFTRPLRVLPTEHYRILNFERIATPALRPRGQPGARNIALHLTCDKSMV
jgi:hypothetical protein